MKKGGKAWSYNPLRQLFSKETTNKKKNTYYFGQYLRQEGMYTKHNSILRAF